MYVERVPPLLLKCGDLIDDLPGPDEMAHRTHLKRAFQTKSAKVLVRELKMTQSVHLLLGIACMDSSPTLSVVWNGRSFSATKSKKRKYDEDSIVDGKYINVAGVPFQTQMQFLEKTCALESVCGCRVSHPAQKIWKLVFDECRYGKKDKVILKQMSKKGYSRVFGDFLTNGKDITQSSLSKRVVAFTEANYDKDCDLLFYSVVAMVHIAKSA